MSYQHEFEPEAPAGEGLRRLMFGLVCLGAIGIAVLFSPALGLIR
jgi:hypothetical protein